MAEKHGQAGGGKGDNWRGATEEWGECIKQYLSQAEEARGDISYESGCRSE